MKNNTQITIAIDGYSSCGKSTLAKAMAKKLNYIFIDTGAMYRAVSYYCFQRKWVSEDNILKNQIVEGLKDIEIRFKFNEQNQKLEVELNGVNVEKEIRTLEISRLVSKVAAIKEVREKLVAEQQLIGNQGGVVMDGRDIGSVVFPNAELKLFITADPVVRAKRRHLELSDPTVDLNDVLENLKERDHLDSTRKESPLIQTEDAIVIDLQSHPEEQLERALEYVEQISTLS